MTFSDHQHVTKQKNSTETLAYYLCHDTTVLANVGHIWNDV